MALTDPLNLLIIIALLAVIIVWGPQRLPQIVRQINRLRSEYTRVTSGVLSELENLTKPLPSNISTNPGMLTDDSKVIEAAKKLGIATEGKTRNQITADILNVVNQDKQPASSAADTTPSSHDLSEGKTGS